METRDWFSVTHPTEKTDEGDPMSYTFDLTFMMSNWQCNFGTTCNKTVEDAPDGSGCCRFGAYLDLEDDVAHVHRMVEQLTDEDWQNRDEGLKNGYMRKRGNYWNTRVHKRACIFHNTDPERMGCAFHVMAMRTGQHHTETKPHVCWQAPLYREEAEEEVIIRAMENLDWGDGEFEPLEWWTIEDEDMYNGSTPVYISLEEELRKLCGDTVYEALAAYCDAIRSVKRTRKGLPIVSVS